VTFDVAFAVVLCGIGVYLCGYASVYWLGILCVVLGAVFALILLAALTLIPYIVFRIEAKFRDEYSLEFSPEGIHFRTAHIHSQLQWSLYTRALVDAQSYLLYYGRRQFTLVPNRVFESDLQRQAFDQLVTEHISRVRRR